jgi:hypothetical protein
MTNEKDGFFGPLGNSHEYLCHECESEIYSPGDHSRRSLERTEIESMMMISLSLELIVATISSKIAHLSRVRYPHESLRVYGLVKRSDRYALPH